MNSEHAQPWTGNRAHRAAHSKNPGRFIDQHVSPLLYRSTGGDPIDKNCTDIFSEEQFWEVAGNMVFGAVRLNGFRLTDWFPRAPGVYWSRHAWHARSRAWSGHSSFDVDLGHYFSTGPKKDLIEDGGIGTIRLRPKKIDGEDSWLATALASAPCHCGIPLLIPEKLFRESGVNWGDQVALEGRVRFLQDANLDFIAARVHHTRPLIVYIDAVKGVATARNHEPIVISPVALFESTDSDGRDYQKIKYTFVQCAAGLDSELDAAEEWIDKYVAKFAGKVITNFDEQRPALADAPLSYQRLVAKTYDRTVIERFEGTIRVDYIDRVVQESVNFGDIHVGHKINVGGSAIINIDSVFSNVTQSIGAAPGLDSTQKSQLESMVRSLKADLDKLNASHVDEAKEIADALEKAIAYAAKPSQERKQHLLQLSAKGLKDAAELVKDITPSILATTSLIAEFILGLQ